ncbi:MAG: hypothetical protein J6Z21_04605 [Lachnospiraceae bacterium]|nr:hypothetical protein [Lachnospiraceae bacterium]
MMNIRKKIWIGCILICVLAIIWLIIWIFNPYNQRSPYYKYILSQCGGVDHPCETDDLFSENVMKKMKDSYLYMGSSRERGVVKIYNFKANGLYDNSICDMYSVCTDYIGYCRGKTMICLNDGSAGMLTPMVILTNYSDESVNSPDYDGFCSLYVISREYYKYWLEPDRYIGIVGIKKLEIPDIMQETADEEGIDWYEIWPDLEEVIVYETDDRGMRIE